MRDGAVNYLPKPIDLEELLTIVRQTTGMAGTGATRSGHQHPLPSNMICAERPDAGSYSRRRFSRTV